MIHSLDPRTRRLGVLLLLLASVLLLVGGGAHLHGDCHDAGSASTCHLAVLVAGALLALRPVVLACPQPAARLDRPREFAPARVRRDARLPLSRAPPSPA